MKWRICVYELFGQAVCTVTEYDVYDEMGTSRTRMVTIPEGDVHVHRLTEVLAKLAEEVAF